MIIVSAGVFAVMLLTCCVIEYKRARARHMDNVRLYKAYSDENLKKMEYDVAFYDKESLKLDFNFVGDEQVTIDELLNQGKINEKDSAQKAIFTHYEDEGVKPVKGRYRSTD